MRSYYLPALKLTGLFIVLFGFVYPGFVCLVALLSPGGGTGLTVKSQGRTVGYALLGQNFNKPEYFCSRPSAGGYNGSASGGSNKGPTNPDYLKEVNDRIIRFRAENPEATGRLPADLVTASGSGLDPDISVQAALVQVPRIARLRGLPPEKVKDLVISQTEGPLAGLLGPEKVRVLALNLRLDSLK